MNHYKSILLCCGLLGTASLNAQEAVKDSTLNRTVVVENQYNPEVMDAYKVNVLPKVEEPAVPKKEIHYAGESRMFKQWNVTPMQPYSRTIASQSDKRGYLGASYGNRNNVDVKAAYLWNITDRDRLDIMASFYGRDGKIEMEDIEQKWDSRFFRTDLSADYRHNFQKVVFNLGGGYASQVFNYMESGHQHFSVAGGHLGLESTDRESTVQFAVNTGINVFNRKYVTPGIMDGAETKVHTEGYVGGKLNDEQKVVIGFSMDNMMYDTEAEDFSLLKLNPYYKFHNDYIDFHAGMNVDVQTSYKSGLKVSPDVRFGYTFADSYVLYANIIGGTKLNDYVRLNEFTPYWESAIQPLTSYTPMDASVGFKASPAVGFSFDLKGGYRVMKDELFVCPNAQPSGLCYSEISQWDAKTGYVGASIEYGYLDVFHFNLGGNYYGWSVDDEVESFLLLKPEYEIDFGIRTRLVQKMNLMLDYKYISRMEVDNVRINALNDLTLSADYNIFKSLNVVVKAGNLLNKKYYTEGGYPVQGFNIVGGISLNF